jgi:DNA-binding NarL/FixJ family response regulator
MIVDDDAMVRAGLKMVLSADPAIEVIAEAVNGQQALELLRQVEVDLVMMDLQMPVMDGVAATRELRRRDGAPAVLILTTFQLDDYVVDALEAGATGYLLKDTRPEEIARAVHVAAAGDSVFSAAITEKLVSRIGSHDTDPRTKDARHRLAGLTEREYEVAEAVAAGSSNATIASAKYMSEATVKTHVSRILAKTGAENRVQIALLVYRARPLAGRQG